METGNEFKTSCSDTMLNYRFLQKVKLLGNDEFNHHLTIILTILNQKLRHAVCRILFSWDTVASGFLCS